MNDGNQMDRWSAAKAAACVAIAVAVFVAAGSVATLTPAGQHMLFIAVLAAALWISEVVPAFSVSLLVITLEIALLGKPGGVYAKTSTDWHSFALVLGDPLIWLFLTGFVLAAGAAKTGLDRSIAQRIVGWCGPGPRGLLLGVMGASFFFSMFISNTATAAMMLVVVAPMLRSRSPDDALARTLVLGVVFGANIGGMATIIGTPPNAIAAGVLGNFSGQRPDFLRWIILALPPAVVVATLVWGYLTVRYSLSSVANEPTVNPDQVARDIEAGPGWQRDVVAVTFVGTLVLWLTGPLHGIPTTVVAFGPITVLTITGVLGVDDIRHLPWDVLVLLAGGLALGVGMKNTGLAAWIVAALPLAGLGTVGLAFVMAYAAMALSNFMSNTAAANILVPLGVALLPGREALAGVPIALGASLAMCLPISTPPNAIGFSTGRLRTVDLLQGGLLVGTLAPLIVVPWVWLTLQWLLPQ